MHGGSGDTSASRAYRAIEGLVVTLELPPGSLTTEAEISSRIGMGRTPVREAVQRLSWEGLLEIRPRAGIAVAPLNPEDWLRMMEVRRSIEIVLARAAARNAEADGKDRLLSAMDAMRKGAVDRDLVTFMSADKEIDIAIGAAAGNGFAVRVASPLQSHSRRFWYHFKRHEGLDFSVERHGAVVDAIVSNDPHRAVRETERLVAFLRTCAISALVE